MKNENFYRGLLVDSDALFVSLKKGRKGKYCLE